MPKIKQGLVQKYLIQINAIEHIVKFGVFLCMEWKSA